MSISKKTYYLNGKNMKADLSYEGRVMVKRGHYKGHNGLMVGYCINYVSKDWISLVSFYEGGDLYAIPFAWLEKIDITGRI
jgi:hypothetical protein